MYIPLYPQVSILSSSKIILRNRVIEFTRARNKYVLQIETIKWLNAFNFNLEAFKFSNIKIEITKQ